MKGKFVEKLFKKKKKRGENIDLFRIMNRNGFNFRYLFNVSFDDIIINCENYS